MSKLIFAELCMRYEEHVPFNSSFISLMHIIYPKHDILYFAEKNHCNAISSELNNLSIKYTSLCVFSHKYWKIFFSDIVSSFFAIYILIKSSKDDIIILLNRLPFTLFTYNLLNIIFRRNTLSILHGELESIVNFDNVTGLTKYYYNLFRLSYAISINRTYYIALGKPILSNISFLNFGKAKILSIDHPYNYDYSYHINELDSPVKIGIIGLASFRKNSDKIFYVANNVYKKGNINNINFKIAGTLDRNLNPFINEFVEYNNTGKRLSKYEYENLIKELDYSLLFYDSSINKALASGSFFDCLKYEKPIIGIKGNDFVDYYFSVFGNIGYLFNTEDEIVDFLSNPTFYEFVNSRTYFDQIKKIRAAKESLSLKNIAHELKLQLELYI